MDVWNSRNKWLTTISMGEKEASQFTNSVLVLRSTKQQRFGARLTKSKFNIRPLKQFN